MITGDRAAGLLAGLLLGDALGAPCNGLKAGHIQQLLGGPVEGFLADPVLFPDKPDRVRLPGLHTAAGQQALAILAGGVDDASGRGPLARAAAHLTALVADGPEEHRHLGALRDPGRPLRRALARWAQDYPWEAEDHFAAEEPSEGAGPALRGLACALVDGADPVEAARLTHLREAPLVAARVLWKTALLLAESADPKRPDFAEILEAVIADARATEDALRASPVGARWKELEWGLPVARLSDALSPLASLLRTDNDALAERTLVAQAREFAPTQPVAQPQHGLAAVAVPWALWRALGPLPPARALEATANGGGEASLVSALAGGLLGARWGLGAMPGEWVEELLAWPTARAVLEDPTTAREEAWLGDEGRWTREEAAVQAPVRKRLERAGPAEPPKKKPKPAEPTLTQEDRQRESLPFAPPPHVWLTEGKEDLAPWERQRLKAERGRKRIGWKEDRRKGEKEGPPEGG